MTAVDATPPLERIKVAAGPVEYADTGAGPAVVFLHPLLANHLHWRKVIPVVAQGGYRCIVPNLPLGAHSVALRRDADVTPAGVARLVVNLVEALQLSDATLIGNDSGGAIAQIVAAQRPDLVSRLILTSCDSLEHFFPPLFRYLSVGARVPGFAVVVGQTLRVKALRHTPLTFGWLAKRGVPHEVLEQYVHPFLHDGGVRRDVVKFVRGVDSRATLDAAERLRTFDGDVLIAWAREDRVFAPELAQRLAAMIPRSRLVWIEDSYAFTPEDQPEVLGRLIVQFCDDTAQ